MKKKTKKSLKTKIRRNTSKRSHSDSSSNESSNSEEEKDLLTSPKRDGKKFIKQLKYNKRLKSHILEVKEDNEEDEADTSDSELEDNQKTKVRNSKRNVHAKTNKTRKRQKSTKQADKGCKVKSKSLVESDAASSDEEDAKMSNQEGELDLIMIKYSEEEIHKKIDHNMDDSLPKSVKKGKNTKNKQSKELISDKNIRSIRQSNLNKSKNSKNDKFKKIDKNEVAVKKQNAKDQSNDDTEQSEDDSSTFIESADKLQTHKSICGKGGGDFSKRENCVNGCSQIKDVYTFELSPCELTPNSATRLVLSSGQEISSRSENSKNEFTQPITSSVDHSSIVTDEQNLVSKIPPDNSLPLRNCFSPKILVKEVESKEKTDFEPLPPEPYSQFEPSFGPNASLSSLSQLSQSIGGGSGPILLNHQSPTKCQINIKEEPKDEQSSFRPLPNSKVSMHRTSSPVIPDHLSTSQNYGTNFVSSNKTVHPRRLWSNARLYISGA